MRCISHYFVQNEVSKDLLKSIGIEDATVVGDTRFDRVLEIKNQAKELPIVEAFKGINNNSSGCKVFVAGSSWQPDEDIFIRFFNEHPDWKLIIAPHVIGEDHLSYILEKLKMKTVRYTQATEASAAEARCLIIDCFGLLSTIYRYGEIAYVGGGFGVGIHNVPEAAVWGVPVIFGPNNKRFQEAQDLLACKGSFEVTDYESFNSIISRLISDEEFCRQSGQASANYVMSRSGASEKIMQSVMGK